MYQFLNEETRKNTAMATLLRLSSDVYISFIFLKGPVIGIFEGGFITRTSPQEYLSVRLCYLDDTLSSKSTGVLACTCREILFQPVFESIDVFTPAVWNRMI